jgi:hypothetical protein
MGAELSMVAQERQKKTSAMTDDNHVSCMIQGTKALFSRLDATIILGFL